VSKGFIEGFVEGFSIEVSCTMCLLGGCSRVFGVLCYCCWVWDQVDVVV